MKLRTVLVVSAALLMGGCDMEPNLPLPTVALSARYKEAPSPGDVPLDPSGQWWKTFGDRTLDDLEAEVEIANPDLAAALAANDRARAYAAAAQAGLYPEIDGVGELSYNRQSNNRPLRSANQPTDFGANQIDAQAASYEVDFWGRVRDLIKAANAQAQASADALAQAKLELHAELASAYIQLRGTDAEAKLLADTTANYQAAYDLTRLRLAAQISPPIDVERAETQLETVKAQALDLSVRRSSLEDAIAALVGQSASAFKIAPSGAPIAAPRRPRTAPADVLLRRPDVAESERFIEAANADIGAARAAFYPRFTINLLGGSQDTGLNLLTPGNSLYSLGPTMSLPLFDGELRKAQLEAANASYAQTVANYRSTILRAVREVEDNLSALRWLAAESHATDTAAEAARKAADMAMKLYRDGASSYLDVVTAQNAALEAERLVIVLRTRQLDANVALMLALGGGWSTKADETNQM
ncbi:MAG: efflux transporter outer membrane subunit [Hyphomicrobiales bacterium]|nr:efflux transporter outer membrane subunit [Hyphomicrobiales bacterium]